jgi:RNA polymerase-binding transcription factor DksA
MSVADIGPVGKAAGPRAAVAQRQLTQRLEELRQALCDAATARLDRVNDEARTAADDSGDAPARWNLIDVAPDDDDAELLCDMQRCESALERLAAGTWGQCVDCGDALGAARLEMRPEAERCPTCQSAFERGLFTRMQGAYQRPW